jgi:hypothetical protein
MALYQDFPLAECKETASDFIADGGTLYQRWTCSHCQTRQAMKEANKFFSTGQCQECRKISEIHACNYSIDLKTAPRWFFNGAATLTNSRW